MTRIAVLTSRRAEAEVRRVIEELRARGFAIDIIVLPIDVAALASLEMIREVVNKIENSYDVIITPGTLPYSPRELREVSPKLVKGPTMPSQLLLLARSNKKVVEKALETGVLDLRVDVLRSLYELSRVHDATRGIEVCGVKVPLRPPPFVIVAEVFAGAGRDGEEYNRIAGRVRELYGRGADIVVIGFGPDWLRDDVFRVLRLLDDMPVGIDSPHWRIVSSAVASGKACLAFSAWENSRLLEELPRGSPVVVIPGEPGRVPGDPFERVRMLKAGVQRAKERGLVVLADPLVEPPLMGLAKSIVSYYYASRELRDVPLVAGIANVYELADVDTYGVIASLSFIFGELGVSVLLVGEESRKAYMAVTEAAVASSITSLALLNRSLPKDLGLDLLVVKEKRAREGVKLPSKPLMVLDATVIASWHGFRQDLHGSHLLGIDHAENTIRDVYIGRRGTIEIRAKKGVDAYKAVAFLGLASEPSHYAFLGYELCKAEQALRLKRSYVMEEDLFLPPWSRPYYSARERNVREPGNSYASKDKC